ncbi:hypothetical protein [Reyranella soli]|uniref:hypothetical protein n=1 Tax=Reyranella soli TaxID=1230389 RepID=UPI0011BEC77C|nr:hypothetical protein [Reyranella soli]
MAGKKSGRLRSRSCKASRNGHAHDEPLSEAACDTRKPGTCAAHCATALLLAVLGGEPVAPRDGCCLLTGSVPVAPQPERRERTPPVRRRPRPDRDTAVVELHLAGDD